MILPLKLATNSASFHLHRLTGIDSCDCSAAYVLRMLKQLSSINVALKFAFDQLAAA